jgi:hypothetical protein
MKALEVLLAAYRKNKDVVNVALLAIIVAGGIGWTITIRTQDQILEQRDKIMEERLAALSEQYQAKSATSAQELAQIRTDVRGIRYRMGVIEDGVTTLTDLINAVDIEIDKAGNSRRLPMPDVLHERIGKIQSEAILLKVRVKDAQSFTTTGLPSAATSAPPPAALSSRSLIPTLFVAAVLLSAIVGAVTLSKILVTQYRKSRL